MYRNKWKIYSAVTISTLLWGISFVWSKKALSVYSPFTIITFRLIISGFLLCSIGFISKQLKKINSKTFFKLFLLAFCEPFSYFIGESYGLTYVSPTVASIVISTIPLFSTFFAYLIFNERFSFYNFSGIIMSIAGVSMAIIKEDFSLKAPFTGILFLFLSVFSATAYSVIIVKIPKDINIYTIITYQGVIGSVLLLPLFLIFDYDKFIETGFVWDAIIPIIELAVFASSLAFMLFTYAIRHLGIVRTNTFANIIPVFTAIFSFILLDEHFSILNILGILVVIVGLLVAQRKSGTEKLR